MDGLWHAPYHAVLRGVREAGYIIFEKERSRAFAGTGVCGEEAEGFFDDGEGVGELVQEVWIFDYG